MQPFAESFLNILEALHAEIERAVEGLPAEALDWVPAPGANSFGVLLAHVAGAERYWLGDVAAGESSGRDRAAEFRTEGVDAAALKERLSDSLAYAHRVLEGLSLQDLEAPRTSPRDGRRVTVAWCLAHALEHTAVHTGHIQLTRQLWDRRG